MTNDFDTIYQCIIDVIEPGLADAGYSRETIHRDVDLMKILDSFGLLDAILEIEERSGLNADMGQMEFENKMTLGNLASEIVRINK